MKTYYASKNWKKYHKDDPDYFVYLPRDSQNTERKVVGKVFKNRSRKGTQFLKIIIFRDEENDKKEVLFHSEWVS
jgi:hypothetical protein